MQNQYFGFGVKGIYCVASYALKYNDMPNEKAKHRYKVLMFCEKHGLPATLDAFDISRRTLFNWKRAFKTKGLNGLNPKSTAPHVKRCRNWSNEVKAEIRAIRKQLPNLGKEQTHILLKPWCAENRQSCPSESTIGRLIKDAPDNMRVSPPALTPRGKPKIKKQGIKKQRRPKHYHPTVPGEIVGLDAIERRMGNLRRFLLCAIDEASGYAVALAIPRLDSKYNTHFMTCVSRLTPFSIQSVNTDNGQENNKHFDEFLKAQKIKHLWTYPRTPKMNAVCERFNRTIQEQFVDYHEHLLFDDIGLFNEKLADWLILYNGVRPHKGKGLKTPVQYIFNHQQKCNMWWTHTQY